MGSPLPRRGPARKPPPVPPRHLLGIEGLPPPAIAALLDEADRFAGRTAPPEPILRGQTVVTCFLENSTRTQISFLTAAGLLGATPIGIGPAGTAIAKGESLPDTARTLGALGAAALVVRAPHAGTAALLARHTTAAVINAGDGAHEHPTQALIDALALRRHFGRIEGLVVAICGDIAHSRVARSNLHLLLAMGAQVRLIGPPTLLPASIETLGATIFTSLEEGLDGADAVMMLRIQYERLDSGLVPSAADYRARYGLTAGGLARAKPGAPVLHPGPMNRGLEIDSAIADDPARSLITEQVRLGVSVRMAVLAWCTGHD